jgi:hypothetical protein
MLVVLTTLAVSILGLGGDPDTVITRKTHADGFSMGNRDVPARDTTQTIWLRGKDKLRVEEGDHVTIVRLDEKKVHVLNTKDKTVSTVDLPFDYKKYIPEDSPMAGRGDDMPRPTVTVKPTDDTKKIKEWSAKRYTVTRSGGGFGGGGGGGGGANTTEEVWAAKDLGFDGAAFHHMMSQIQSMRPGGDAGAEEMKKIEGVPVLIERTRTMRDQDVKSREELASVEHKEAPAGAFDVPADFTKKPFDMRSMMGGGFGGGRGPGGGRGNRDGAASRSGNEGGAPASKPAGKDN